MEHKEIQNKIDELFKLAFVHTPLTKRLEDIAGECRELCNYTDLKNLKEEAGDLLASVIQLCNESGWDIAELLKENEKKIRRRILQYQGRGRKTRIALIGGAFNPIHESHVKLAEFILKVSQMDEVWFVPCNNHLEKKLESAENRMKMIELAVANNPRIKVSDYEIRHQLHGETFHFLNKLIHDDEYENYRFFFVVGQDRADTIREWYNSEDLIKLGIGFICVPRKGYERNVNINWYLKDPHIYIVDEKTNEIPEISSTKIKNKLVQFRTSESEDAEIYLSHALNEDVLSYIIEHKLYEDWKDNSKKL